MKNINYHRSALDKMRAHEIYCLERAKYVCPYGNIETQWHSCKLRDLCFNAWLHSNREGEGK